MDESYIELEFESRLHRLYLKGKITLADYFAILRGEMTEKEAIERKANGQARWY